MMKLLGIFTVFDWVTPALDLGRSGKRFAQGKGDHYLFVTDGMFGTNLGRAEATLRAAGITFRRLSGSYHPLADGWMLEIRFSDREQAMNVLRKKGVQFNE